MIKDAVMSKFRGVFPHLIFLPMYCSIESAQGKAAPGAPLKEQLKLSNNSEIRRRNLFDFRGCKG